MKTKIRITAALLALALLLSSFSLTAFAIDWDGASADTGSDGGPVTVNGYALRYYPGDNCIGYRFSCVDRNGNNRVTKVIDVFRNTYYGNYSYDNEYKFTVKYNKKQLIDRQYSSFSTSKNSTNCYRETSMGFATPLGTPDTMAAWQNIEKNLNVILTALGIGTVDDLESGDMILVEPLYDIKLQTIYHSLTVTEVCLYGATMLGMDSDGGTWVDASQYGSIATATNKVYPNHLFTPDGQGLWPAATLLSERATFRTAINVGYGVGIAYTETQATFEPELNVQEARAYKGTAYTKSFHYGTSTADSFSAYTFDQGYPACGDTLFFTVYFPVETENTYVKQTVWIDGTQAGSRTGYTDALTLFDVTPGNVTVSKDKSYYRIEAEEDWIDADGNVLKYGTKKAFYIPVKPTVYREKVTAYDLTGTARAYSGKNGRSGSLYSGQQITAKYTYTSENSWGSYNNLTAIPISVSGSSDVDQTKALLSSAAPKTYAGTQGYLTVPKASEMTFTLGSAWYSDTARTKESSTYTIPVVSSDVELSAIALKDSDGNTLDPQSLLTGEMVYVYYTYKNNASVELQVDGYDDAGQRINTGSGYYSIPSGKSITVAGGSLTVPDSDSFSIWGGVYLHGRPKGDTSYETNGTNNARTLTCQTKCPLSLIPIIPNASYREGTEVISSFWLKNEGSRNYTQTDQVSAKFTVKRADGSVIATVNKTGLLVPGKDQNLVYIRWTVPEGLNSAEVTIDAVLLLKGKEKFNVSKKYGTTPYTIYSTPDTQYERAAPSGLSVPNTPANSNQYASWWIYTYANGKYTKNEYCIGLNTSEKITPATGETDYTSKGQYVMKSGYGLGIDGTAVVANVTGYRSASSDMYTTPQYVTAAFPEFGYKTAKEKARTLLSSGSKWIFRPNGDYGNVHFTPLYYPDGGYTVSVTYSDLWTPGGMISVRRATNTIKIEGSAYDDWYIGR